MNIYLNYWRNTFNFKDSAGRDQFWIPSSINAAIIYTIMVYVLYNPESKFIGLVFILFWFANLLPQVSVMIRRFRDADRSIWFWLWGLIPIAGPIIVIYALAQE